MAKTAETISREKNYSIRAKKYTQDELGVLIDGFNEMLAQIQDRDNKLENHRNQLEGIVAERTYELQEREEQLSTLINSMPDIVCFKDQEGRWLEANKADLELFQLKDVDYKGKKDSELAEFTHPVYRDAFLLCEHTDEEAWKKGSISRNEEKIPLPDGGHRIFDIVKAPLFTEDGERKGLIVLGRDITEQKKMEEELLTARKLESVGVLAGGIAHDFNNILTAILGNVSLAKIFISDKNKALNKLEGAERACIRAKDLTQQLLTFSKGGAPVKKTASIGEIIKDSATFVLSGSNVRCEFHIPDDIWAVEVDEGQMNQVINNMIMNADQAMPEGGIISVRVENITIDAKDALPLQEGRYVRIEIEDQGIGIPREHLGRIFDPYFSTKSKGSGLGLASCYSIIKKHDGLITVESEMGVGTTFTIYLPATSKEIVQEREKAIERVAGRERILVMDDEELVRDVAGEMLKLLECEPAFASDGSEAIRLYKEAMESGEPYDVVIMDLTIPGGMGGKEAIKKLLEIDPAAKALVSSGYANDPVMAEYKKYGFKGVIRKPYKIEEIKRAINELLGE
jgi:PAS domain S-box-containing protein